MKMKHYWVGAASLRPLWIISFLVGLLLIGCGETAVAPTATPIPPTATAEPTPELEESEEMTAEPSVRTLCSPDGERPLTVLALGDSYTIGESVTAVERWPIQLVGILGKQGVNIGVPRIIAQTGWTTNDLQQAIAGQEFDEPYQVVTLLIGVNNQYRSQDFALYETEFQELLDFAIEQSVNGAERVFVLSIPDWGVMPFAEGRDLAQIATEIDAYNAFNKAATLSAGANYVEITEISRRALEDETLIANDGLHPSGVQYGLWVEELLPQLCAIEE